MLGLVKGVESALCFTWSAKAPCETRFATVLHTWHYPLSHLKPKAAQAKCQASLSNTFRLSEVQARRVH